MELLEIEAAPVPISCALGGGILDDHIVFHITPGVDLPCRVWDGQKLLLFLLKYESASLYESYEVLFSFFVSIYLDRSRGPMSSAFSFILVGAFGTCGGGWSCSIFRTAGCPDVQHSAASSGGFSMNIDTTPHYLPGKSSLAQAVPTDLSL